MNNRDIGEAVDIVVVGSGAGAMTAALTAAVNGASVLILEKSRYYGGTSATSGGGLWIPYNHLMLEAGVDDDPESAMKYLTQFTGDDVAPEVVRSFVDNGAKMLRFVEDNSHVRFQSMVQYADYYQELEGAAPGGRSIDPLPYHAKHLGTEEFLRMSPPHVQTTVMGLMGYSNLEGAVLLSKAPGWMGVVAKLALRYFTDLPWRFRSRRSRRLTMGNALIGRLRRSLMDHDVPLWTESPVTELLEENGRVTGVVANVDGKPRKILARKGVIIGSGGFEHSDKKRHDYLPSPTDERWSAAYPSNTGDLHDACARVGAAFHLMDEAWWGPTVRLEGEDRARMLFTERSMPGCIMVNSRGRRFVNESVAYTTAVQAMYENADDGESNLPTYVVFDARYRRNYPFGPLLPGGMHLDWLQPARVRKRFLKQSNNIRDLAEQLGVDPAGLESTVDRFNGFAESGVDQDFHRGENSYDKLYGDVRVSPNPCLAPLSEAPFYGVEIYPGDIGTKGGMLTNAKAQVLNESREPIEGLYAIGNCSASSMGRYYPGAGATIGPAMTFGYVAARDVCDVE